jgi:hypothetical protein
VNHRYCAEVAAHCLRRGDGADKALADSYNLAAIGWALVGLLDLLDERLPSPAAKGLAPKEEGVCQDKAED